MLQGQGAVRQLVLKPEPDAFGKTIVTLKTKDRDGLSCTNQIEVTILPVNDSPGFTKGADLAAAHDAGAVDIQNWATGIKAGPPNEADQTTEFHVETDAPQLFSDGPRISRDGTLSFTPARNRGGRANLWVWLTDNGGTSMGGTDRSAEQLAIITMIPPNTPPIISEIADQIVDSSDELSPVTVRISDAESPVAGLALTAASDDQGLVPDEGITFAGNGSERTMEIRANRGQTGSARISVRVSDGDLSAAQTFTVTVRGIPPSISAIADRRIPRNSTISVGFTLSDRDSNLDSLVLTAESDNSDLLPASRIAFKGSGAEREVMLDPVPDRIGSVSVTLTASDGAHAARRTFQLVVIELNRAPSIGQIPDQTIDEDQATGTIRFTISDPDSAPEDLTVSAFSDNPNLAPNAHITLGGAGAERTIAVRPLPDWHGAARIGIIVSDGELSATNYFGLTANPVNDSPVIVIASAPIRLEGSKTAIPFAVSDADDAAESLTVAISFDSSQLLRPADISIVGTGDARKLVIDHSETKAGSGSLLITLSDPKGALAFRILKFEKIERPEFRLAPRYLDGGFTIKWKSSAGARYQVQWKRNLTEAWNNIGEPIGGNQTSTETSFLATDADAPSGFFRAVEIVEQIGE